MTALKENPYRVLQIPFIQNQSIGTVWTQEIWILIYKMQIGPSVQKLN